MQSGDSWQVTGVRRRARDIAREAARRSGMSVGEWLDNVILDSALHEGTEPRGLARPQYDLRDNVGADRDKYVRPEPGASSVGDDRPYRAYDDNDVPESNTEHLHPSSRAFHPYPVGFDDHAETADREVRWRAASQEDHQLSVERDVRQPAADSADVVGCRAAELAERLCLTTVEDRCRPAVDQGFAGLNDRLDSLARELGEIAEKHAANAQAFQAERRDEQPSPQLVEIVSKLDQRLDQLIAEGRSAKIEIEQRVSAVDRAVADLNREIPRPMVAADPPTPLDQALIEIADRQRTLDGYAPIASDHVSVPTAARSDLLPRPRTQELSGLEQQLRQINTQIETLKQPCGLDKAVDTLRDDLAEIGLMLQEAMPRKAIEALESEVRKLADRVDHSRDAGADGAALAGIEQGLAELRDALRALTPAENLVGIGHAVQQLSEKVDLITSNVQDPAALKQLEGAIVTMRGIVSHVASDDALARLSEEVRALGGKIDQAAGTAGGGILSALEGRIATLADALEARNQSGRDVPHELETVVHGLIDKIERIQLTRGDQAALGHLEDRIAGLVEKLDASDARLNHLEAIERGLAELLIHLEHQRVPNLARAGSVPPEVDELSRDIADLRQTEKKTLDTLEVVHGTLGHVVDRLAMIETDIRSKPRQRIEAVATPAAPSFSPAASAAPMSSAPVSGVEAGAPEPLQAAASAAIAPASDVPAEAPRPIELEQPPARPAASLAGERRPIDPSLPPDHPLEPGAARSRNAPSPADRIAASEAALAGAKPPVIPDPGGKPNFIAAARRAAQAAGRDAPAKDSPSAPRDIASAAARLASRVGKLRALIGGTTAILIVLGSLQFARTQLGSSGNAPVRVASESSEPAAPPVADLAVAVPVPTATAVAAGYGGPPSPVPPSPSPAADRQTAGFPAVDGTAIMAPTPGSVLPTEIARPPVAVASHVAGTAAAADRELTGSVPQPAKRVPAPPAPASPPPLVLIAPAASPGTADRLPAAFGGTLRAAAAKGDSAAQYEIALRYAEGRGVPQNLTDAAEWFERAAKQGLVPAQFRLGGFYEKGLGVKKNLDTARRLYLAAGEAGNAKALHNLAVLYAEGIDGKPDYQTAAKWFRKAADYGVPDSQYNLAILYARGIGMEQNLTEAYRWFALAARDGDSDSAKKRDDIGARLDPQSFKAASQAVEAWMPAQQPEAAVQVKTPPGGWDSAETRAGSAVPAPAPAKHKSSGSKLDLATPRPAQ